MNREHFRFFRFLRFWALLSICTYALYTYMICYINIPFTYEGLEETEETDETEIYRNSIRGTLIVNLPGPELPEILRARGIVNACLFY